MASFNALNSYDFELLVQDLLGAELNVRFESFPTGRDGGIDLRLLGGSNSDQPQIIVQCKHYETSGFSKLKSKMKDELPTAQALNASRYILATTVPMPPGKKTELMGSLNGLIKAEDDIYAKNDIERLIRDNPSIEKAHFKLWLNSTAVLERVLRNDIINHTEHHQEMLKERARLFVYNESVKVARDRLENDHVCIISGAPGVGKSTLADILLMTYVAEGFEPVILSQDASEANSLLKKGTKQFFYYDDFLGRTTLAQKLGKNEDDRLHRLISHFAKSPNKRFVLTTREHIFNDAQVIYDRLDTEEIELTKFVLDVEAYTKDDRGKILYNHLYFSDLSVEHLEEIVASKIYRRLVQSRNFNPRLVEESIKLALKNNVSPKEIPQYLSNIFDKPSVLWKNMMINQFSLNQKSYLLILLLENGSMTQDSLELFSRRSEQVKPGHSNSFERELQGLEGTAIKLTGSGEQKSVQFSNPGVEDAIIEHILTQADVFSVLAAGKPTYKQVIRAWNYANDAKATRSAFSTYRKGGSILPRAEGLLDNDRRRQQVFELSLGNMLENSKSSIFEVSFQGSFETRILNCLSMAQYDTLKIIAFDYFDYLCKETVSAWKNKKGSVSETWNLIKSINKFENLISKDLCENFTTSGIEFIFGIETKSSKDFEAKYFASQAIAEGDICPNPDIADSVILPKEVLIEIQNKAQSIVDNLASTDDLGEVRETLEEWESLLHDLEMEHEDMFSDAWDQIESWEMEQFEPDVDDYRGGGYSSENESIDDLDYMFDSLRIK